MLVCLLHRPRSQPLHKAQSALAPRSVCPPLKVEPTEHSSQLQILKLRVSLILEIKALTRWCSANSYSAEIFTQYYIQSAPKKCQPQKSVKIKDSTDIVQKPLFSVSCDTHWGASSVSYNSHISETV